MQRLVELAPGREAHASGGLWLAASRILILADVHLGYAWAQRRRGQLGPVSDGGAQRKLDLLFEELKPARAVFLGDVVHAPRPSAPERAMVEDTLQALARRTELILVRGNHDRAFARDYPNLGIDVTDRWEGEGIIAVHGDRTMTQRKEDAHVVVGHLHPAVGVRDDAGASQRIPAFLAAEKASVLPAFSPFAAGFNVCVGLPAPLRKLLGTGDVQVIAATGKRTVRLGSLAQLRQHEQADSSDSPYVD